ncbi:AAA-like domain-containing protein [Iningainema tapete]|uniref:AAA-like domain-containing protein n=1 Tax=Iningainema tapete BLCC-T55 TaxID=2748662 RepID=A0A8J6XSR6_9CYAN|nr:AAA-like domain-containing protein [Iningainema tapete]MBD2778511.1 AAA-like domain-containing protein [Iningainema tapete BLCC-T55]
MTANLTVVDSIVKKILILSANPQRTSKLRLDEEVREIQAGLERAKRREQFEIITKWAVRVDDLRRALLDYEPQIVHFSGHGAGSDGLALENNSGNLQLVSTRSLARLFKLFQDKVECVLLNACYSEVQAQAIHQNVDCVIGMSQVVGDRTAIEFAVGFYDALGAGRSYEDAFEFGCTSIDLEGIPESETPVLKTRNSEKDTIPSATSLQRIFISYKRNVEPDEPVATQVYQELSQQYNVFIDRRILVGTRWAESIETELRSTDFLIVFLSEQSVNSEMVQWEISLAQELAQRQSGKPVILPVRLAYREAFPHPISIYLNQINWAFWETSQDTPRLIEELRQAINGGSFKIDLEAKTSLLQINQPKQLTAPTPFAQPVVLEMPSGTMKPESAFYVERNADAIGLSTIVQLGVTIPIKGPRQVGKSSLLMRLIQAARNADKRVAYLDFQQLNNSVLSDSELFFRHFCCWISDVLELEDKVEEYFRLNLTTIQRCDRYLQRHILKGLGQPLVLAMDEVDRVFDTNFRNDFFGMLRSWHNSRAIYPSLDKLDLVLVTSTEPYQLIDDLNQSPFNVGQIIELEDFTTEQVTELNRRHGSPFDANSLQQLFPLLSGHPYLVRKALYLVASRQITPKELFTNATAPNGPFGDHLRRLLSLLYDKQELIQGLQLVISQNICPDRQIFWRLQGSGLVRASGQSIIPRCDLYAEYFRENLHG